MSNKYTTTKQQLARLTRRSLHWSVAVVVLFAALLAVMPGRAHAYAQVTSRSIMLSSSQVSATNVAYKVGFTTVTDGQTVGSVVVEFCANSPIIGDTCAVTGTGLPDPFMNANISTLSLNSVSGNITGLSIDTTDSTANRVVLTRTAGAVANGPVSFTLGDGTTNGFTNPSTPATFYARIMLFTNTTGTPPSSNENNATDAGGVAISTANQLLVTAKVQESLLFCVYTAADCATGGNSVSLGDQNGVLASTSTVYTSTANFDVSSNAISGVSIRLKGDTLKSGTATIDPFGNVCTADSSSSSVSQFGLRMSVLGAGVTATAPYNCLANNHGFDNNSTNGTTSLFGEEIAKTSAPSDVISSTIEFAAKSANTSQAGVYVTALTLVATATY